MQYRYLVQYINEYNYLFKIILSSSHDQSFLIEVLDNSKATIYKKSCFKIYLESFRKTMCVEQKLKKFGKKKNFLP